MSSIRSRLTVGYAAALVGTMVVFAMALYVIRRASMYEELRRYVTAEANLALNIIRQTESRRPDGGVRDSLDESGVAPKLDELLAGVPDYVFVFDNNNINLYRSQAIRQFSENEIGELLARGVVANTDGPPELVTVGSTRMLLIARAPEDPESEISRVVVAATTDTAEIAISELFGTILVISPFLLLASLGIAYLISSRALKQIDRMINEVQAITDGRSLHRRLPVDKSDDELGRLALTLNEMMERLESSFGALRRFTADASHELKTPLAVLRADVERAMSPAASRAEKLVALEEALHETTRMADLVASLLTLARADENRFNLDRELVDLTPLIREIAETAQILGEDAGLHIAVTLAEQAVVLGDATRLRQLFLNLITNAIKYTPRGGSVELTLSRGERTAAIAVRDTGVGIPAADLPHVFERFYRSDRARSRTAERGGFGLGLAISQWIAEAHGGSISVRSRYMRGSTFTVTLPLAQSAPQSTAESAREQPTPVG